MKYKVSELIRAVIKGKEVHVVDDVEVEANVKDGVLSELRENKIPYFSFLPKEDYDDEYDIIVLRRHMSYTPEEIERLKEILGKYGFKIRWVEGIICTEIWADNEEDD